MKLCYFGLYNPAFGRNKVYISGLRQNGVEIVECRDTSKGIIKFWKLWQKHRGILKNGGYDAMIVGYPGHLIVPFAKLLARKKPVIFDALCTLYEGEIISRGKHASNPFMKAWINLVDKLAALRADAILVETNAQKEFFIQRFGIPAGKIYRVWSGADEETIKPDHFIAKRAKFTAVFRGKLLPEAGVRHIIRAAKILEQQGVDILILGDGFLESDIGGQIDTLKPVNLYWIPKHLEASKLYQKMQECHVALGQFEKHERLSRTIPHKAFEALALGMPYVTGRSQGISELLTDGKDCLMANLGDPEDIAAKILHFKNQPDRAHDIGANGRRLFDERLTSRELGREIKMIVADAMSEEAAAPTAAAQRSRPRI